MADWRLDELTDPYTDPPKTGPRPKTGAQRSGFRAHKLRALATSAIVVLALGGFSAIMVYAYKADPGGDPAVVPLIRADISPTRIRPERPGGLQIPYQDRLILREGAGRTTEMPALEGPVVTEDLPRIRPVPSTGSDIAGTAIVNPAPSDGPAVAAVPIPSVESASASARNANTGAQHAAAISNQVTQARTRGIEQVRYPGTEALIPRAPRGASMPEPVARPSYLETLLARSPAASLTEPQPSLDPGRLSPDATDMPRLQETAANGIAEPALDPAGDEPSVPAPAAATVSDPEPDAEIVMAALPPRPRIRPETAATATPAAASPAPPATAAPVPQADGDYRVQLASVSSDEAARGEWERLQRQHPALLGGLGVTVRKAQVNGRDYYRVQAGPLDKTGAASLCGALKAANGDCLVTGP